MRCRSHYAFTRASTASLLELIVGCCVHCVQEQKENKVVKFAQVAAASVAAVMLAVGAVAPSYAEVPIKNKLCASNPTSKLCTKNSFKK